MSIEKGCPPDWLEVAKQSDLRYKRKRKRGRKLKMKKRLLKESDDSTSVVSEDLS